MTDYQERMQKIADFGHKSILVLEEEPHSAYETPDYLMKLKQVQHKLTQAVGWMGYVYYKVEAAEVRERDYTKMHKERGDALREGVDLTDRWQASM